MMSYKLFLERKMRNPLRKKQLASSGEIDYTDPKLIEPFKNYIRLNELESVDDEYYNIKLKYDNLLKSSEALAEKYLDSELGKILDKFKRLNTKEYRKILDIQGIQVFVDDFNLEDNDYRLGSYNQRVVKSSVLNLLLYTRDILPNRKVKIVITDISKNEHTTTKNDELARGAAGMAIDKLIFIDWRYIDEPKYYVHEYAHALTDLMPTQSKVLLVKAFVGLINEYYSKMKKRTIKSGEPVKISKKVLNNIAKKLNFPEYGTQDPDEFFAVVIENWKELPNNRSGYKFKTLVKSIINRV